MNNWIKVLLLSVFCCAWLLAAGGSQAQPSRRGVIPAPKLARLQQSFQKDRWVAYTPTELDPRPGHFRRASAGSIAADLKTLRPYFDVLVTYSCDAGQGMDQVVPIAAKLGFRVCLGIWDVKSVPEIAKAVQLARQYPFVVLAVVVGNETLLFNRADWETLEAAVRLVQAALPSVPVSTSEPISAYGNEDLRRIVDFHAPNCHWVFASGEGARHDVERAVEWLKGRVLALQNLPYGDKPTLIKEHGLPAGPAPFSPELQAQYVTKWRAAMPPSYKQASVFFEAFSAPWKTETNASHLSASESMWGAWDHERHPRSVINTFRRAK